jgi:hypothetical protein
MWLKEGSLIFTCKLIFWGASKILALKKKILVMEKRKEKKELVLFLLLKVNDKLRKSGTLMLNQPRY